MRKDPYDTYVRAADCDEGSIDWSEDSADMRVCNWDGDDFDERELCWHILSVEVPAAQEAMTEV